MARVTTRVTRANPGGVKSIEQAYLKGVKRAIALGAVAVRNTAVNSIQNSPRGGGEYTRYNPRRVGRASGPGEPPATDTGFLVSNIAHKIDSDGLGADIESNADYSGALEFGTSRMEARPYLQPALEENRRKIRDSLERALRGSK